LGWLRPDGTQGSQGTQHEQVCGAGDHEEQDRATSVAATRGTCGRKALFPEERQRQSTSRQVFWLPDHPTRRAFPPTVSGSRWSRWGVTRYRAEEQWLIAAVVPGYSGGTATDLHRFPYSLRQATSRRNTLKPGDDDSGAGASVNGREFRNRARAHRTQIVL